MWYASLADSASVIFRHSPTWTTAWGMVRGSACCTMHYRNSTTLIVETAALYNSTTMLRDSRRICYDIAVHPMLMDSV
jgi:hypothetical protein